MKFRWRRRPDAHDISCAQAVAMVTAYLERAMPARDLTRFEAHLAECPHCQEHLKQIEVTILVTGQVRAKDLDLRTREELMDLYRRWRDDPAGR